MAKIIKQYTKMEMRHFIVHLKHLNYLCLSISTLSLEKMRVIKFSPVPIFEYIPNEYNSNKKAQFIDHPGTFV